MKQRKIGNKYVSEIGFGCMGMSHAAGKAVTIEEGVDLLHCALDAGYTYFDTAKNYGNKDDHYHNEKILGKAFKGIRDKVFIATKTGVEFDYSIDADRPPLIYDSSEKSIRESIEGSLLRLDTDYVDLYFQARIDPLVEPQQVASTMKQLYKEGKILGWGISEAPLEYLQKANEVFPLSAVEYSYSIINRDNEKIKDFINKNNITWIAHGPLAKGLLSGIHKRDEKFSKDDWRSRLINNDNLFKYDKLISYLNLLAKSKNATASQICLAWILAQDENIIPIPGSTKKERIKENSIAGDINLTSDELNKINTLGKECN